MDYSILIINGETEKKVKTGGTDYERFGEKDFRKESNGNYIIVNNGNHNASGDRGTGKIAYI